MLSIEYMELYSDAVMITHGMKQSWNVVAMTLDGFLEEQQARWGHNNYNAFEVLKHGQMVTPYFDLDVVLEQEADASVYRRKCMSALQDMFEADEDFQVHPHVKVGYRHGWINKNGVPSYKVSWRFWVRSYQILMEDMPKLIREYKQQDLWDASVYSNGRKMGIPGGCKGDGDYRILQLEDREHPGLCIIQNLANAKHTLKNFETQECPVRALCTSPPEWDDVAACLHNAGFGSPIYCGRRDSSLTFTCDNLGMQCTCCGLQHDSNNWWVSKSRKGCLRVKNYSSRCKVMTIEINNQHLQQLVAKVQQTSNDLTTYTHELVKCFGEMQDGSMKKTREGFEFRAQADSVCGACNKKHNGTPYQCQMLMPPCYQVRNVDPTCKPVIFNWQHNEALKQLVAYPNKDEPFAEIFRLTMKARGVNYVYDCKQQWYVYSGVIWQPCADQDVLQDFKTMALPNLCHIARYLSYRRDTAMAWDVSDPLGIPTADELGNIRAYHKGIQKAYEHLQSAKSHESFLKAIKQNLYDRQFNALLDRNPDYLGCLSGVIDLKSGMLLSSQEDLYVSKSVSAKYKGLEHPTPDVDDFFNSIFNAQQDVIAYLKRFLGYSLTAHMSEQVFAIFYGCGANGKGLLNQTLETLLGGYYKSMSRDCMFNTDKKTSKGQASPHLAELQGVRLGVVDEASEDDIFDSRLLKQCTGESSINCRFLNQNNITFRPTHKQILMTNHRPRINTEDKALLRRLVIVPFSNVYKSPADVDPHNPSHKPIILGLASKLSSPEVLEQLLTWLTNGAIDWYTHGLGEKPDLLKAAQQQYVDENDALSGFIKEHCDIRKSYRISATSFRTAFLESSDTSMSTQVLKKAMCTRGFVYSTQKIDGQACKVYIGLQMK